MTMYQLDLLKDPQISRLEAQMHEVKKGADKVRRGIFARFNQLQNRFDELHEEHEAIKQTKKTKS